MGIFQKSYNDCKNGDSFYTVSHDGIIFQWTIDSEDRGKCSVKRLELVEDNVIPNIEVHELMTAFPREEFVFDESNNSGEFKHVDDDLKKVIKNNEIRFVVEDNELIDGGIKYVDFESAYDHSERILQEKEIEIMKIRRLNRLLK